MVTVNQLLNEKGRNVLMVGPDDTVLDAISKMASNDVGSLVVLENGELVGIITERHYARNVFLKGRSSPKTTVGEIMSTRVVCVKPEQSVEECMAVMTENGVRHLPVLEENRVIGLISIGDLVKSIISDQKFVIEQLEHYISG
ncbi:CBS domain-containing protein [Pseudohalocynthiibacter aestuariivivens]|uniref:CBS domain-containing protein n=1 Tax=Pseudohalocynthiibacter aestuariivivens TaxID=1591409 RepID=A0ABV5JJ79_9RHOB|nr:CBS domain-containing protein [Pseudohalocynthiibacter aestuariivivens]MBS9716748.1 CBS domain-containing protein [Pseudohalocynthiibacter aestuariivivens]